VEPLTGTVAELWRWPVLGMAPERLRAARLGRRGMAGDGVHLVVAGEEVLEAGALEGWSAEYPFNVDSAIDPEHPPQALVIPPDRARRWRWGDPRLVRALTATAGRPDRKSTRLNSSHPSISYAVFCLKKKTTPITE